MNAYSIAAWSLIVTAMVISFAAARTQPKSARRAGTVALSWLAFAGGLGVTAIQPVAPVALRLVVLAGALFAAAVAGLVALPDEGPR